MMEMVVQLRTIDGLVYNQSMNYISFTLVHISVLKVRTYLKQAREETEVSPAPVVTKKVLGNVFLASLASHLHVAYHAHLEKLASSPRTLVFPKCFHKCNGYT